MTEFTFKLLEQHYKTGMPIERRVDGKWFHVSIPQLNDMDVYPNAFRIKPRPILIYALRAGRRNARDLSTLRPLCSPDKQSLLDLGYKEEDIVEFIEVIKQ